MPTPIDRTEYERAAAVVTYTTLSIGIQRSYPELSIEGRDAMFVAILDRVARMRGFSIRREFALHEDTGE